jgi:hypothetical protein
MVVTSVLSQSGKGILFRSITGRNKWQENGIIVTQDLEIIEQTLLNRSVAGIVDSNPTHGMDVWCVYAFVLCLCCPVFR